MTPKDLYNEYNEIMRILNILSGPPDEPYVDPIIAGLKEYGYKEIDSGLGMD